MIYSDLKNQALILTQALLGCISPNFRMIHISIKNEIYEILIILEKRNEDDIEEIEDLKSEYEALQPNLINYNINIEINEDNLVWPDNQTSIILYKRRE